MFVQYEALCDDPAKVMFGIYDYLEEDPFDHDFDNIKKEVEENSDVYGPYGNHEVKPKIERVRRNDWDDIIPPDLAQYIRQNHEWYFNFFSY